MQIIYKEAIFHDWCLKCKHKEKEENEDPCWDCLTETVNEHSHKPVYFEGDSTNGKA